MHVLYVDDWSVWAEAPGEPGKLYWASAECWPEWANYSTPPEEMSDAEYQAAVRAIVARGGVAWRDYRQMLIDEDRQAGLGAAEAAKYADGSVKAIYGYARAH